MRSVKNEKGAVLVFMTLMIVLLMIMVGMGLDTGQLTYTRSQGQAAVDAAALSAVSGLPVGAGEVNARVATFNAKNDYLSSPANPIGAANITYVKYDHATGAITDVPDITTANGVRVALEKTNPYTSVAAGTAMKSPLFLTPLLNLFGQSAPGTADVSVSAVAALSARPSIPIAVYESLCGAPGKDVELLAYAATVDNSCWTSYWTPPVNTPVVQDLFTSTKTCSGLPSLGNNGPIHLGNGVNTPVYATKGAEGLFSQYPPMNGSAGETCWLVPVVPAGSTCNRTDTIKQWAKICPYKVVYPGGGCDPAVDPGCVCPSGANKCIRAKLTCGESLYTLENTHCFASRLVREPKSATCPGCAM